MLSFKNFPIFVFYLAAITTIIISITNTVMTAQGQKSTNLSVLQTLIGIYLGIFIAVTSSFKSGKSGRSLIIPYITGFALYFFGNLYSLLNIGALSDIGSEITQILGSLILFYSYRVDSTSVNLVTFLPAGFVTKYTNKVTEIGDNIFGVVFKKVYSTVKAVNSGIESVGSGIKKVSNLKTDTQFKYAKYKIKNKNKKIAKIAKQKAIQDFMKTL